MLFNHPLVKEKEEAVRKARTPMDVVPLAAIPGARVSTSGTTSTIGIAEGVEQLAEAIQNLSIQIGEIKKLQNELKELQHMKVVAYSSHVAELQRGKG